MRSSLKCSVLKPDTGKEINCRRCMPESSRRYEWNKNPRTGSHWCVGPSPVACRLVKRDRHKDKSSNLPAGVTVFTSFLRGFPFPGLVTGHRTQTSVSSVTKFSSVSRKIFFFKFCFWGRSRTFQDKINIHEDC